MKIVPPLTIATGTPGSGTILTTTNVLEDDATLWSAGTIALGQQRIYNHRLYEVIANPSTTDQPDIGAAKGTPTWLDLGPTNRWKMFDGSVGSQTTRTGTIVVTLTPGQVFNGIALFKMAGTTLTVTVTDPTDGLVYSNTIPLQDNTAIVDWYSYFFEPIEQLEDVALLDLPNYGSAVLSVTIDAGVGTAKCGELLVGRQRMIGETVYGSGVGIQDYSVKSEDGFGGYEITERAFAKRADFDVRIDTPTVSAAQKYLASIRATPAVFVGVDGREETVLLGFYKSFSIILSNPSKSDCSIEVEGLA